MPYIAIVYMSGGSSFKFIITTAITVSDQIYGMYKTIYTTMQLMSESRIFRSELGLRKITYVRNNRFITS